MAPCRVFKYYKNIYRSKNLTENPEKFWVEYSNRLVGLGQVASLTKSGQEPMARQLSIHATQFPRHGTHRNSVQKSTSSWGWGKKLLNGMRMG